MAEDKKNRKSSRHFNLEKPVERSFEIEKDADILVEAPAKPKNKPQPAAPTDSTKKSGDIKKPSDTPKMDNTKKPEEETVPKIEVEGDTDKGNSSKWKWLIPAAIVVAAVPSYFLFTGNDDSAPNEDKIVMNSSLSGQDNANDDTASPNAATGENDNSENSDNSAGSDDIGNSSSTENASNSDNNDSGSSSSETGSVENSLSGAKAPTQPLERLSSPNNNKPNSGSSASSTTTTNRGNDNAGRTGLSSGQGKSVSNNSENAGTKATPVIPGSIEQKALDVIRGVFGNGQERKDKLGAEYAEIQKLVNEMYRTGKVKH